MVSQAFVVRRTGGHEHRRPARCPGARRISSGRGGALRGSLATTSGSCAIGPEGSLDVAAMLEGNEGLQRFGAFVDDLNNQGAEGQAQPAMQPAGAAPEHIMGGPEGQEFDPDDEP